ncbi:nucleotidyltransferase domain-containing protein [Heyndrickxia oleronia]|uniref:nucleotidyltransferase domain-containing protein n=1 Tax=Heyndrickxia oleronia TaxID=38875 RepID=UPI00203A4567|nr:nucleotidyltransferase domain-containing protein [Heyndrickxia oleronia]MCM3239354.1 nucleotidyltransferase domain-containing protein [Heyndrickxia oleronia]
MIEIGKLHAGYGLDPNGFIVSDVSRDKIDDVYMPCIRESVERLKRLFQEQLHSVYMYGSVARGEAIVKKSDLDLIAMFETKLSSVQLSELKQLAGELSQNYRSLVREVGIAVADYEYMMDPSNYYENAFLKELCVCVYGEDLGEKFGPYTLTSEIAIRFNGDIYEALNRTLKRLETSSEEDFKIFAQAFARKLIRTYYSMVMVRSQIWTTRLHEQSEVFIHHFPEKESIIRTLLDWIDVPPTNQEAVYELFKSEGDWASANFSNEAKIR